MVLLNPLFRRSFLQQERQFKSQFDEDSSAALGLSRCELGVNAAQRFLNGSVPSRVVYETLVLPIPSIAFQHVSPPLDI